MWRMPRREGCPYEGHVPHTGRARTQEVAPVSKSLGSLAMLETHHPLKSRLNDEASLNMAAMFVTLLTFHEPMSAANAVAP